MKSLILISILIPLALLAAPILAIAIMAVLVFFAPEGYEDDGGFHYKRK